MSAAQPHPNVSGDLVEEREGDMASTIDLLMKKHGGGASRTTGHTDAASVTRGWLDPSPERTMRLPSMDEQSTTAGEKDEKFPIHLSCRCCSFDGSQTDVHPAWPSKLKTPIRKSTVGATPVRGMRCAVRRRGIVSISCVELVGEWVAPGRVKSLARR